MSHVVVDVTGLVLFTDVVDFTFNDYCFVVVVVILVVVQHPALMVSQPTSLSALAPS